MSQSKSSSSILQICSIALHKHATAKDEYELFVSFVDGRIKYLLIENGLPMSAYALPFGPPMCELIRKHLTDPDGIFDIQEESEGVLSSALRKEILEAILSYPLFNELETSELVQCLQSVRIGRVHDY